GGGIHDDGRRAIAGGQAVAMSRNNAGGEINLKRRDLLVRLGGQEQESGAGGWWRGRSVCIAAATTGQKSQQSQQSAGQAKELHSHSSSLSHWASRKRPEKLHSFVYQE